MSQSRSVHRLLGFTFALALLASAGCPVNSDATFAELADFTQAEIARQKVPGAAIAVVENGAVTHQMGFGTKQLGKDSPVQSDTLFGIGSATKMLVASAVLTLREQGKVDLDAPVTNYVPTFQLTGADPSSVQVRHLLDHTSGLPDFGMNLCAQSLSEWFSDPAQVTPLWSTPGKLWNYSNRNYSLAGLLLENVSGQPFAQAMQTRIFGPAGMIGATFDPNAAMAGNHSLGHAPDAQMNLQPVELDTINCPVWQPAGGAFYASAPDMARFAQALLANGAPVLKPDSVAAMEALEIETHWFPGESYGFGLFARDSQGTRVYYHGGADGRFMTTVVLVPSRQFAIVVLLNSGVSSPEIIAQKALDLFLGISDVLPIAHIVANPTDWQTPPSTWTKYTGMYFEPYTYGHARITVENGVLMGELVDLDPGSKAPLTQLATDTFTIDGLGMLTFWFEGNPDAAKYGISRAGVFTRTE
ncbi:MAG TPA: serine hydrolase domain-containing protein [Polyangia bacterium]